MYFSAAFLSQAIKPCQGQSAPPQPLGLCLTGAFITQHVLSHLRSGGVPLNLASPSGATACCDPWWIAAIKVFWDLRAGSVPWAALIWLPEQGDLDLADVSTAFEMLSCCVVHSSLPGPDTAWGPLYIPWTHKSPFLQSFTHCLHLLPGLARAVLEAFCFPQGKLDLEEQGLYAVLWCLMFVLEL